jgi:hypothetical protein
MPDLSICYKHIYLFNDFVLVVYFFGFVGFCRLILLYV